jgi:signal transduction histidine kinase
MMGRLSLRARTTVLAVLVFGAAAVAAGYLLITVMYDALVAEVDRSVSSRAADIGAQVISDNEEIVLGAGLGADTFAMVFTTEGLVYDSTDPTVEPPEVFVTIKGLGETFDADLRSVGTFGSDNLRATAIVVDFDDWQDGAAVVGETNGPLAPDDFIIYVGTSRDGVDRTVDAAMRSVLIVGPILIALVGILTWFFAGRALRPVAAIRAEVDDISATGLHRRVPQPPSGDEIARLASTMNRMLGRLEAASTQQRQFVSDASHELRSPLAAMQARLDVAVRHGDTNDWHDTAESLRADVGRMHKLVEDLLVLARRDGSDGSDALGSRSLVDLDDLVFAVASSAANGAQIDVSQVSAGLVDGSADALRRVVQNLIDNAVRHAEETVVVRLDERDGDVVLLVDDDGAGIAEDQRDYIFERFVRLDEARSRDSGGSGLGLAISREIVLAHGGTLRASAAPSGGARFELVLPAASADG